MGKKPEFPKAVETEVVRLKQKIRSSWKKGVSAILEMGESLAKIKKLVEHQMFLHIVEQDLSMSYMQACRLIAVHTRFGSSRSMRLLQSRPSTLYLLAASGDLEKVEKLARGGQVLIDGRKKTIDQVTVRDAQRLRTKQPRKSQANNTCFVHRNFATTLQKIHAVTVELEPIIPKLDQRQKNLTILIAKESVACLTSVINQLK